MALHWGFGPHSNQARLSTIVDRVCARVQNPVWQRVQQRVLTMGVHEARGYIRARAALVIERELGIISAEEPDLRPADRDLIERSVRYRVIRRLLFESIRRHDSAAVRRRRLAA